MAATRRRNPYRHVHRNQRKPKEGRREEPFRALRPVSKRKNEAHDQQPKVEIVQDQVNDVDAFEVE